MTRSLLLFAGLALPLAAQVKITEATDRISILVDGKPFTDFIISADVNKPFLHPLRSASGKIVTRHYPMEMVEGERRDHPHHRGLWFSHGDVNGFDFWGNEKRGGKFGRIALKKIINAESGKKSGTVEASFDWLDPDGKPLLNELRRMVFYSDPALRTIDFDILLTAVTPVKFGDTKEGTFAMRLADKLREQKPGTGTMVSADGKRGMKDVWGSRSPWVDYFGELDGEKLGIAIFDQPGNPRHPTWWHARDYGLFAANPFGQRDFERDPAKDGSLTLEPKQTARFRYRVVIHPGDVESAAVAKMYEKYAKTK